MPSLTIRREKSASILTLFVAILAGVIAGLDIGRNLFIIGVTFLFLLLTYWQGIPLWKVLSSLLIAGSFVLNYGFTNLSFSFGSIPIPISYLLLLGAFLVIGITNRGVLVGLFNFQSPLVFWLVLLLLSILHLVTDIFSRGMIAVRDANFVLDGMALLMGAAWASSKKSRSDFLDIVFWVTLLNLFYMLTYPWADFVRTISPVSGVYRSVPLLGAYFHSGLSVLFGIVFSVVLARYRSKRILVLLLPLQFIALFLLQSRALYIGLLMILFAIFLSGEFKFVYGLVIGLVIVIGFLALLQFYDFNVTGRIGEFNIDFLGRHLQSLFLVEDAVANNSIEWRLMIIRSAIQNFGVNSSVIWGQGFGVTLIDYATVTGHSIRQPHNIHLTVLLRLGVIGFFVWICFLLSCIVMYWRRLRSLERGTFTYNLWLTLFLFTALGVMYSTVQTWMEFTHGAVIFYAFLGFSVFLDYIISRGDYGFEKLEMRNWA